MKSVLRVVAWPPHIPDQQQSHGDLRRRTVRPEWGDALASLRSRTTRAIPIG